MNELWTYWWVWIVAALAFALIEVFVPAFVFLGLAVGALVVGLVLGFGLLGWIGVGFPTLLFIFAGSSVLAAVILRRVLGVRRGQVKTWDRDINE